MLHRTHIENEFLECGSQQLLFVCELHAPARTHTQTHTHTHTLLQVLNTTLEAIDSLVAISSEVLTQASPQIITKLVNLNSLVFFTTLLGFCSDKREQIECQVRAQYYTGRWETRKGILQGVSIRGGWEVCNQSPRKFKGRKYWPLK